MAAVTWVLLKIAEHDPCSEDSRASAVASATAAWVCTGERGHIGRRCAPRYMYLSLTVNVNNCSGVQTVLI